MLRYEFPSDEEQLSNLNLPKVGDTLSDVKNLKRVKTVILKERKNHGMQELELNTHYEIDYLRSKGCARWYIRLKGLSEMHLMSWFVVSAVVKK